MQVVIFCGGRGTRISGSGPEKKELVEIGDRPILWHIMKIFAAYGHKHFLLPLGYRGDLIRAQ
jgi:glucose-1-phosphate cytidylyltransferase